MDAKDRASLGLAFDGFFAIPVHEHGERRAIGRRYRRQDEVGTPYCITIDGQTMQDGTVTIRDRDTLAQERVAADHVARIIQARLST